jgi:serine/threonine protein kinase/Flp pilus assembly protein TadD
MSSRESEAARIFLEAVEQHECSRWPDFVREAAAGDPLLLQRVEALLKAHGEPNPVLDAGRLVPTEDAPPPSERPGAAVGPYRLLEQIGEGGFGVVYLAEQAQPVRRKVALKVLKPGMDSRQVVARFEAERQALALMDHPSIAKVLDGGATPEGRPYFVMELVRGAPITDFCDRNRLGVRQRLELFLHICRAVQHAHTKGIIHRDLKPTNVLVTLHDGKPVPKVIDFGVAKALGHQLTDKTLYTGFDQLIGTPLYMSPEQAALSGLDVDTRSDIYALGVLLYELLTGTTPFDRGRFSKVGYDEMRRIIREEEPPRPSTRIRTLGQASTTISTQRKSDPRRLSQLFRGELDWVVMKCLEKDRTRRYETANALARDIERYLHDEPVQACPPSASYRLRKFVRRNKGPVLAAALGLVLIAVLGGGVGWYFRDRSTRQAVVAARVHDALDESERLYRAGEVPDAVNAARRAASLLDTGPADDALTGRVQERVKDLETLLKFDEALFQCGFPARQTEYERLFRAYGIDLRAQPAEEAAALIRGRFIAGDLAAAIDLWVGSGTAWKMLDDGFRRKLVAVARQADPDPWRDRARRAFERDDTAALEELARTAPVHELPPATLRAIAILLVSRYPEGAPDRPARDFLRRAQRRSPSDVWLNHLLADSLWLHEPQDYAEAAGFFRALMALRPNSPLIYGLLGSVLLDNGKVDDAAAYLRTQIERRPTDVLAHSRLALARAGAGDLTGYRSSCAAMLRQFGQTDEPFAAHCVAWASVLAPDAVEDLDRPVKLAESVLRGDPQNDPYTITLGAALYRAGRFAEAIRRLRGANAAWENKKATKYSPAYTWLFLAMAHHRLGQAEEARRWLDKAVKWAERETRNNGDHWDRRLTLQLLRREAEGLLRGPAAAQPRREGK